MLSATLHEQEIREAVGVPGEGDLVIDGVASLDAAGGSLPLLRERGDSGRRSRVACSAATAAS